MRGRSERGGRGKNCPSIDAGGALWACARRWLLRGLFRRWAWVSGWNRGKKIIWFCFLGAGFVRNGAGRELEIVALRKRGFCWSILRLCERFAGGLGRNCDAVANGVAVWGWAACRAWELRAPRLGRVCVGGDGPRRGGRAGNHFWWLSYRGCRIRGYPRLFNLVAARRLQGGEYRSRSNGATEQRRKAHNPSAKIRRRVGVRGGFARRGRGCGGFGGVWPRRGRGV